MLRKQVIRLLPCEHLLHETCSAPLHGDDFSCPLCRQDVVDTQRYERRTYAQTSARDRELIVDCSNRGDDWKALAVTLGVNYKTAYTWIRSGTAEGAKRGGRKPKLLTRDHVDRMIAWLEEDCSLTLVQIKARLEAEQVGLSISTTSIANYLEGEMFTTKKIHWQPSSMNSTVNKELRRRYIIELNNCIQQGRQVLWIDETNFNLFCRRDCGRSRQGARAVAPRPTSRGENFQNSILSCQTWDEYACISIVLLINNFLKMNIRQCYFFKLHSVQILQYALSHGIYVH